MRLFIAVTVFAMISKMAYIERGCFALGGEIFIQFAWMIFIVSVGLEK